MSLPVRRTSQTASAFALALAGVALVAALVTSCSNATGPAGGGISVGLVSVTTPTYSADSAGRQIIACDAQLEAHNSGAQSETWEQGEFRFYDPIDTTTPHQVTPVGSDAVWESWGTRSIGPDSSQTATWHFWSSAPFILKILYRANRPDGSGDSSIVRVPCSPKLSPGSPPQITTFAVAGDSALEPGDTLHLAYTATSAVGLWQTIIRLGGACDSTVFIPERRTTEVTRALAIMLPPACSLGSPVTVTGTAVDAGQQTASAALTLPGLTDHTPPTITLSVRLPDGDWTPAASIVGYLFAGDSIGIDIHARDNHRLHAAYWNVQQLGLRDSLFSMDADSGYWIRYIHIKQDLHNTIQVAVYATDSVGLVSDTVSTAPSAITVYPTLQPAPIPLPIPGGATDVAIDQKRGVLYLLQNGSDRIEVRSLASGDSLSTIPVPPYMSRFELTPGGDSLIVLPQGARTFNVVDLTQTPPALTEVPLVGLDSGLIAINVRVASTGLALAVAKNALYDGEQLYSYDFATDTGRMRTDAPDPGVNASGALERSTDGTVIVANGLGNSFVRYDALTDAFETPQTALVPNSDPTVDSTGANVVVAGDLYDASLQYVRTMLPAVTPGQPGILAPDGQTYFTMLAPRDTTRGIVRYRVSDGTLLDRIPLQTQIHLLRISPDGKILVAAAYDGSITIIDLTQLH